MPLYISNIGNDCVVVWNTFTTFYILQLSLSSKLLKLYEEVMNIIILSLSIYSVFLSFNKRSIYIWLEWKYHMLFSK